jgi:hypothetical protein
MNSLTTPRLSSTPLERYLKRATFGLSEPRRQAIWDELEEHILTRQDGYCLLGHDPETALQLAIRELGPALKLSAGMNRVHNLAGIVAAALGLTLALGAAAYAVAQQPDYVFTVKDNVPARSHCGIYDNPAQARRDNSFGKNQVTQIGEMTCVVYGEFGRPVRYGSLLDVSLVKRLLVGRPVTTSTTSGPNPFLRVTFNAGGYNEIKVYPGRDGHDYVSPSALLNLGLGDVVLHGYSKPVLSFRNESVKIDAHTLEASRDIYGSFAGQLVWALAGRTDHWHIGWYSASAYPLEYPNTVSINTPLIEDEAVVIITNIDKTDPSNARSDKTKNVLDYQVAPVKRGGLVELQSRFQPLHFVKTLAELKPAKGHGAATALMVRLTDTRLDEIEKAIILPNSR